jgi:acyl-CoA synthetase (AMP-forming)/AMP-acid ligase II
MTPLTYTDLFNRAVIGAKSRVALIDDTGELTYAQLQSITTRFANALIARGFRPGAPFALLSPNTSMALASMIGGLRAGGVWSNINLRNAVASNVQTLSRGGCEAIFFHSSCAQMLPEFKAGVKSLHIAVCLDKDLSDYPSLLSFAQGAPETPVNVRLDYSQIGMHGSTGGTTGLPKVTEAGEAFLSMSCLGLMIAFRFDQPPVNLTVAPITHAAGIAALGMLAMGGTVVMMATPDLGQVLEFIPRYRISWVFLPPTVIYALLKHPLTRTTDFSSLKYLVSGAGPIAVEKLIQAHELFGPVICQTYGQTESGLMLAYISPEEVTAAIKDESLRHRLYSVGRQVTTMAALEIMDEKGEILPPGEVGEIVIQAPTAMHRYLGDPQATAEIQKFGW